MHSGVVKEVMCLDRSLERREGISRCVLVKMVVGDRHTVWVHSRQKEEHNSFGMTKRVEN